jgi:predicted PolB exonuclease-like 3'-5' exonuclease
MTPVLCFDLETIPDVAGIRRLGYGHDPQTHQALDDAQVAQGAFDRRREKTGSDFLPLHLQRVLVLGCLFRDDEGLRIRCLGVDPDDEATMVRDFYKVIERYSPQLVSWNGAGFDLPVLHYRGLVHGLQAPRYWDMGEDDRDFKYNNYISRYHQRHLDLMDLLALYGGRAGVPLDELAKLCGFPGKLGMDGSQVWSAYQAGQVDLIRAYCETDVANTYLLYCRFQLLRGHWTPQAYDQEIQLVRTTMESWPGEHWRQFLAAWDA